MQNFRQKIFSVLLSTHPVGVERSADVEISGGEKITTDFQIDRDQVCDMKHM